MKKIIFASCILFIGCAHKTKSEKFTALINGAPVEHYFEVVGEPSNAVRMPTGQVAWRYESECIPAGKIKNSKKLIWNRKVKTVFTDQEYKIVNYNEAIENCGD